MEKNVIAFTAFSQDAACCLIRNGVILAAAREERFTRIRHDRSMPQNALIYCLEAGDITLLDIDLMECCGNSSRMEDEAREFWGYTGPIEKKKAMPDIQGYMGKAYTDRYIKHLLDDTGFTYSFYEDSSVIVRNTASVLAQGFITGWYQGRMEFNQACGNRAILKKPCNAVKSSWPFQPLFLSQNPLFNELVAEFNRLTGYSYLLQASLNMPGEPLAESPEHAVECFINSNLDFLVMGHFQLERTANLEKIKKFKKVYQKLWPHVTEGVQ